MKKILLIEDNKDIRDNTSEILELSSYKVIIAEDGKNGVEKAIKYAPDLIICDIMLPMLDGYGVIHAIQRNDAIKNIPFIFLTAKTEREDFRKGMDLGADDYITKPFEATELLRAVDSRLKKIQLLKAELTPGIDGLKELMQISSEKNVLQTFTSGRNTNNYNRKQKIYKESNHPDSLFYVVKGKVKTYKINGDGKELVTNLYTQGDFLGYISLLEGGTYKDNAEAMEETVLAVIPKREFTELLDNNKEITLKFIKLLAKNVIAKEEHLLGLAYNSLRKKVAEALILLHKKYSYSKDEIFVLDITRESLATIAGTATESLIRTLGDFKNEKLIEMNEGKITVVDQTKLERLAN